jgi:ATP-dependent helicase YprA (DUF1998 family)
MDILSFHQQLIDNYSSYIRSFLSIKDPEIRAFVDQEMTGKKLWPDPLVQFNPRFEQGQALKALSLHPVMSEIFEGYNLFKHQEEALLLGSKGKEFVVTSGTGSGKSLTYIATIFNHILQNPGETEGKSTAIIVYPMNALINSQFEELCKFELSYLKKKTGLIIDESGKSPSEVIKELKEQTAERFPITYAQYTGQENEELRAKLRANPPHILLTNYVMLELILTRAEEDAELRAKLLQNVEFLVFDELHTYRGRQGSDVSMLIRRFKAASKKGRNIKCIGTSATMVSGENASLAEQRSKVAEVASKIFGTKIKEDQVINEYLVKSLSENEVSYTTNDLKSALKQTVDLKDGLSEFIKNPVAHWLEENIALESKEGIYIRRKPTTLKEIAKKLAAETEIEEDKINQYLQDLLVWANELNNGLAKDQKLLPYRIHQFISQTGTVYATLGNQDTRSLLMDTSLYAEDGHQKCYPLAFSRNSGHEFYCVSLNLREGVVNPRALNEKSDAEEEEEMGNLSDGYIFIQHKEDEEPLWDFERDQEDLPDAWFSAPRKDGSRSLIKGVRERMPRKVYFDVSGAFSFDIPMKFEGWFMPEPLKFDPSSGAIFDGNTSERIKLMTLGGEGRSTATTVLSFETIALMHQFGVRSSYQKLLSFTDNRQDASLQAGHFNDFIKVGQIRAAIAKALAEERELDYSNITSKVQATLNLPQEAYAKSPSDFPAAARANKEALELYLTYRIVHDLRRSWRVVMPNLEQCALLQIDYKDLNETLSNEALVSRCRILSNLQLHQRVDFVKQVLDFFRKSYALQYSYLDTGDIDKNSKIIREKLVFPWVLDEGERLEPPKVIRVEKLLGRSRNSQNSSISAGRQSVFGRYLRTIAADNDLIIKGEENYAEHTYELFDFLKEAGWLHVSKSVAETGQEVNVYKLKVDTILWEKGDGQKVAPDKIKHRSFKSEQDIQPNTYFKRFYSTAFSQLKVLEGREHTGQINSQDRKDRESQFREGKISALYCSPTMELGIDISDLSVVHMRNVPPSPSNYAQRSGRAGRSGQAALVLVYCSNYGAHDRHYFKNPSAMVAGVVTEPRMDLINQELLRSHLHASILTVKPISGLRNSIGDIILTDKTVELPLKDEVLEILQLNPSQKELIRINFKKVLEDSAFKEEIAKRQPSWLTDNWINDQIAACPQAFDQAFDRWRVLYRAAQKQIVEATAIINNRVYGDDHEKKKEARKQFFRADSNREQLLNKSSGSRTDSQSEFYPYRYLAAEGFLPGYNFTRLPVRLQLQSSGDKSEYVSRSRSAALREFGPKNIVYHNGSKFQVDQLVLSELKLRTEQAKVSADTGYFLIGKEYGFEVDPMTDAPLQLNDRTDIHSNLIELAETRAIEQERITCQEEERSRKGYDVKTYFALDGGIESCTKASIQLDGEPLLNIHYMPACRMYFVNLKWRVMKENGFDINMDSGRWINKNKKEELEGKADIKNVKLYTSDTANAIYLVPVKSLALDGGSDGVITLMFALKRAIENYFLIESSELGATIMGKEDTPNIMIYEASEGSLGVLSQLFDEPDLFAKIAAEAYRICYFNKEGKEITNEELPPASYDDLLSYYNQYYHPQINRYLIRDALQKLSRTRLEIQTNSNFTDYEQQYQYLQKTRDLNSSTEDKFLKYLYKHGLRLPDVAQPSIPNTYVKPDFLYHPNVLIFCDGTPHDENQVQESDTDKRAVLKGMGYQVLVWYYGDDLAAFITRRPDIFKKVK